MALSLALIGHLPLSFSLFFRVQSLSLIQVAMQTVASVVFLTSVVAYLLLYRSNNIE